MNAAMASDSRRERPALIAPLWHTILFVAIVAAMALYGVSLQRGGRPGAAIVGHRPQAIPLYLSLLAAEWGLVRFTWALGLRRTGASWRNLIGGDWSRWRSIARDAALALALWALLSAMSSGLGRILPPGAAKSIDALLPQGGLESGVWIALSLSAGFCEEFVFRGYLQTQLFALTGSPPAALVLQAALFAIGHAYQGTRAVIVIFGYGLWYGALAHWRKSLRPGMLAHAWTDIVSGLLLR
jgi:membrane protease YdiL (CAAX protease family)